MLKQLLKTVTRPIALGVVGLALLMTNSGNAQVATDYTFSSSSGTYTPITGGTVLGSTSSDDEVYTDPASPLGSGLTGPGFSIGFDFIYNGVTYDRFAVTTNGYISLGQSALTPSVNLGVDRTPLSKAQITPSQLMASISAFGGNTGDLQGQTGSSIRFDVTGTAPNRTLIVQWENYRSFGYSADSFNFQYQLHETSNIIDMAYGTMATTLSSGSPSTVTSQVGLLGFSPTDYTNRTTTTDWTSTTAGTSNTATMSLSPSVFPPSGLIYSWTPPTRVFSSSTTTTPTTVGVNPGSTNQAVALFDIVVNGYNGNINATAIY